MEKFVEFESEQYAKEFMNKYGWEGLENLTNQLYIEGKYGTYHNNVLNKTTYFFFISKENE